MEQGKRKFRDSAGKDVEGIVVEVDEAKEQYSDIKFKDGTRIRIKPVVTDAIRLDGQWDAEGNPVYVVRSTNVVIISDVNKELRRKDH